MSRLAGQYPNEEQRAAVCAAMCRRTIGKDAEATVDRTLRLLKIDDERRLATVIVSTVTKADGTVVVDHQDDTITIDDLEDAFIDAFADGGAGMGDEMHERLDVADVVQHFTLSKAEWAALGAAMGVELPPMPEVGIAKMRVTDDETWARVKKGDLPEMSFTGQGVREPV